MIPEHLATRRQKQKKLVKRYIRRFFYTTPKTQTHQFASKTFFHSILYSLEGIAFAFQNERNIRTHFYLQLGLAALGIWVGFGLIEWVATIQLFLIIQFGEFINTCLEWLVDWLTDNQYDIRAKRLKDMAAGTCMIISTLGYGLVVVLIAIDGIHHWPLAGLD